MCSYPWKSEELTLFPLFWGRNDRMTSFPAFKFRLTLPSPHQYTPYPPQLYPHFSPGEDSRQFEDTWTALAQWQLPAFVGSSLAPLPKLVGSADTTPPYHHKFALNMLAVMASHENVFTQLQTRHHEVRTHRSAVFVESMTSRSEPSEMSVVSIASRSPKLNKHSIHLKSILHSCLGLLFSLARLQNMAPPAVCYLIRDPSQRQYLQSKVLAAAALPSPTLWLISRALPLHIPQVLSTLTLASETLDVNSELCLPLAATISSCLQHSAGRHWAERTGNRSPLVVVCLRRHTCEVWRTAPLLPGRCNCWSMFLIKSRSHQGQICHGRGRLGRRWARVPRSEKVGKGRSSRFENEEVQIQCLGFCG